MDESIRLQHATPLHKLSPVTIFGPTKTTRMQGGRVCNTMYQVFQWSVEKETKKFVMFRAKRHSSKIGKFLREAGCRYINRQYPRQKKGTDFLCFLPKVKQNIIKLSKIYGKCCKCSPPPRHRYCSHHFCHRAFQATNSLNKRRGFLLCPTTPFAPRLLPE